MSNRIQSKKASPKTWKPGPYDWHPADIVAALRKAGWSLRALSRHHNHTHSVASKALQQPYPNAERMIADAIGVEPHEIWPSRYQRTPASSPEEEEESRLHVHIQDTSPGQADNVNDGEVAQT